MADTGYTSSDSLADASAGYRAHVFKQPNSFFTLDSEISYNGFHFPPFCQAKATIVPEYNKAQTAVKWLTVAITIEFIVSKWNSISSGEHATIDEEMNDIRQRLSQPCQELTFYLQGLGTVKVGPSGTKDVNFGPKPQVLDWEPLAGGLAARCQWLCVTWISPCYLSSPGNPTGGILDFSYEISWSVDAGGFVVRTITGEAEVANTRISTSTSSANPNISMAFPIEALDRAKNALKKTFPRVPGFHREESFNVGRSKKTLKYVVTDTELRTDQAYPKGILNLSLDESLSASFEDKGFAIWDWSFSGSVEVHSGLNHQIGKGRKAQFIGSITNNKQLAFSALQNIIRGRLNEAVGKKFVRVDGPISSVGGFQSGLNQGKYDRNVSIIPNRMSIRNSIYGNSLSVDASFTLLCSSDLLFQASGMFSHVRTPRYTWAEWLRYLEENGLNLGVADMVPENEIVVDLCHPLTSAGIGPDGGITSTNGNVSINNVSLENPIMPGKESTWIDYHNTFYFLTKDFTVAGVVTSPSASEQQEKIDPTNDGPASTEDVKDIPANAGTSMGKAYRPELQTTAEPIEYVTMVGSATRLGYKIRTPKLVSVGKSPAILTGDHLVSRSSMPTGFTKIQEVPLNPNEAPTPVAQTINMYRVAWRKTYSLKQPPQNWDAITSGVPQAYI